MEDICGEISHNNCIFYGGILGDIGSRAIIVRIYRNVAYYYYFKWLIAKLIINDNIAV